jgi:DNA mismatch repair ATPase MutS
MTKNNTTPKEYFENNISSLSQSLSLIKKRIKRISLIRIIVFLTTVIGIYIAVAYNYSIVALSLISGFGLFIYLVRIHINLEKKKVWTQTKIDINNNELKLLVGNTEDMDSGEEFLDSLHPYNEDLDVFGKKSLFQLINRTTTTDGRKKLAYGLNNVITNTNELKLRQNTISELCIKADWRQNFQTAGRLFKEDYIDLIDLITWSKKSKKVFNTSFYRIMLVINPLLGLSIIALIQLNILTIGSFILFLFLPFTLIGSKLNILNRVHADVSKKSGLLLKYSELLTQITNENFTSDLLVDVKQNIAGEHSAHIAVKQLSNTTKLMDYRLNIIVGIFLNIFLLWDIKQAIKIEKWKIKYGQHLENWLEQLSTVDELQSFAGFAFNNPNSTFPVFCSEEFNIEASNLKHPFIISEKSIGNDISISGWSQFKIITGANMAGKSTYLRTVGINLLLAMTGSPVLANKIVFKPVHLFTGIKTTDSLQDGESYFFAELKRLKDIINNLERGKKLFIILDEVLRGTNSIDKQKGSMALITQLIKMKSAGIIATHDLELGKLAEEFPENIHNNRFEVEIINNELVFDYKLKQGISQNLNATFLMKKMGITV